MQIEIINTGSELLLGHTLNTHQSWLGRQLGEAGLQPDRLVIVPDTGAAIAGAVGEALGRADLVLTTGGLGPTADDRTRTDIAALLDRPLEHSAEVQRRIETLFAERGRPVPPNAMVQAQVPLGARVLPNDTGSAPGLILEVPPGRFRNQAAWLVMLPGPPRELYPMFLNHVLPWIRQTFDTGAFHTRTYRTTGIGESRVEASLVRVLEEEQAAGLGIGYCARTGEVDVRFSARGPEAQRLIDAAGHKLCRLLGDSVYSTTNQELEQVVIGRLQEQGRTLVAAESCTGGFISHRLTNVPGASEVFLGGLVTYSNAFKQNLLGVSAETLAEHGAVSEATAKEMAAGARSRYGADLALAVTGIAGPDGGTPDKPVGTVFLGLADADGVKVSRQFNPMDRETFKFVTSQQGLDMIRHRLLTRKP